MKAIAVGLTLGAIAAASTAPDPPSINQHGRCALYGNCGKSSMFGGELPCPANSAPRQLDAAAQQQLEKLCGPQFNGPVCCTGDQVSVLEEHLQKASAIIGSCPACHANFVDVFCQFTCSPHQGEFVEVLANKTTLDGRTAVSELNYYLNDTAAARIYDSCAEVKFSATNGRAMDLIGGGAQEYQAFFKFLGDEKPMLGGSPFQMNFPWNQTDGPYHPSNPSVYGCAEGSHKCACMDCSASCPELEPLKPPHTCHVWGINCYSLGLLAGYMFCIFSALGMAVQLRRRHRRKMSALQLQRLIDDEEDEDRDDDALRPFASTADLQPYKLNSLLESWFTKVGYLCAKFPFTVMGLCTLLVLVSSLGLFFIELLTEPAQLWVGPKSLEAREKKYFDDHFGPFYRTEQLFIVNKTGPVLQTYETLEWLVSVEDRVADLRTDWTFDDLQDFCFKPMGSACVVESVTQYFSGNLARIPQRNWQRQLDGCARSPVNCLPPFGQPIPPSLIFGPYNGSSALEAPALITTWVVENRNDIYYTNRVQNWEAEVERLLETTIAKEAAERGLEVGFNTESSMERELNKSSNTDVKIIAMSYLFMFLYASLALGSRPRGKHFKSKFGLGMFGIISVLMSISASIGLCSLLGYPLTLIITEVIPFLVLAVGIDNIFLLVHQLDFINDLFPDYSVEDRIARTLGLVGPSIVLSTSCETVAFLIGASVAMPAVHNFAIYSAVAVLVNSILQLTMFVAAMSLDERRSLRSSDGGGSSGSWWRNSSETSSFEADETVDHRLFEQQADPRRFSNFIVSDYTPWLLSRGVKQVVVAVFMAWLAISLTLIPQMTLGLDQRLAVPKESFLVQYFSDVYRYFESGPPVYFVSTQGAEDRDEQQKLCGRFSTCDEYSLTNIVEQERQRPEVSFIAAPVASWIDDFFQWLNPDLDQCCLETGQGHLCSHQSSNCHVCYDDKTYKYDMEGFPEGANFTHYLNLWLEAPSDNCPLAGRAPYSSAIARTKKGPNKGEITASNFRTAHVPLRSQRNYIDAYAAARRIADEITSSTGIYTFPYSIFYVYFAQYRTIVSDTLGVIGTALALLGLISSLFLGSFTTALVVTGVVAIMTANIAGLMVLFGVSLNALSLVNLVICVGIGVEFCIHIARSYTFVPRVNHVGVRGSTKTDRAFNALAGTGGSVFGGIAVTKLIGVAVLAFTRSQIFEVYYFRMWVALIICATTHSLALLPVALSLWGGKAYLLYAGDDLLGQFEELEL